MLWVMSYNIHGGIGVDGRLDIERVARTIESGAPDVVGLQEVHRHFCARTGFVDQAAWLADRLNMQLVFGANVDEPPLRTGDSRRKYGTALLSNSPISAHDNTPLPNQRGSEQRGILRARIAPAGESLWICNTHLQHDSAVERRTQVGAAVEQLGATPGPVLLMGDLNATPESTEITDLTSALTDLWPAVGAGPGYTHEAPKPNRRIDYVLASAGVTAADARVLISPASDHLPVVVDVVWPPER